jgi:4-amino-4-deoxy-L-arabinose transferase-like glycosyltransferase
MIKPRLINGLSRWQAVAVSILAGLLLFIPFNGGLHLFDWDEINFAESAREMIVSGNYLTVQIKFEAFWEKPPLFIWFQVLSMKLFGINEFAARFPNAIAGIFTLIALYFTGRKIRDARLGSLWMLVYAGSILPFFYFKSGIIDPWFNLFIFLGISFFSYYFIYTAGRLGNLLLAALFTGLAVLTKGPVAILVLVLVFMAFLLRKRFVLSTSFRDVSLFIIVLAFTSGFWFILQIFQGNFDIILDFIQYQIRLFSTHDAGHKGFLLYHFVVLLLGVFPASLFAIPGLFKKSEGTMQVIEYSAWMRAMFWIVLILFTIVKTKIVHYSSLCYFPLTLIAALQVYNIASGKRSGKWYFIASFATGLVYALLLAALVYIGKNPGFLLDSGIEMDAFTRANIQAEANWSGWEALIAAGFIAALSMLFIRKISPLRKVVILFGSGMLFVWLSLLFITPRIEEYSQKAAIDFFKSLKNENVYVNTLGYKSYAHLFYAEVKQEDYPAAANIDWLMNGDTDKPVYFVFKVTRKERYLKEFPMLEVIGEKNGFVFSRRNLNYDRN